MRCAAALRQTAAVDITFFDRDLETAPRERLRTLQEEKLSEMLDLVHGKNRFVTAKLDGVGAEPADVRTLDDLARLPFTTKAELMAAQDGALVSDNCTFPETAYTRMHQTSGTTGAPLRNSVGHLKFYQFSAYVGLICTLSAAQRFT